MKTEKQKQAIELIKNAERTLLSGGSSSGKSVIAVHAVITRALLYPDSWHLICRRFQNSIRRSMWNQTIPSVMQIFYPGLKQQVELDRTQMLVKFPNGSVIALLGIDNEQQMDKILGVEFATILIDEITEISYMQFDQIAGRLRQRVEGCTNRIIACCNPTSRTSWIYKYFVEQVNPVSGNPHPEALRVNHLTMNPMDNLDNIATNYMTTLESMSERQRKRFMLGEWISDIEGAVWNRSLITRLNAPEDYDRIVIGVDPAVTSKKSSDMTGIIVALSKDDEYWVLRDSTMKGTPRQVARKICALWRLYKADKVVVETNQGGDYVLDTIREFDCNVPVYGIHHKKGKLTRAEPISYLYESGRVFHTEIFVELEDEMCSFTGNPKEASPDRLDALVIALHDLSFGAMKLDLTFAD
jgi:PBSX family phage terminase large subunit